MSLPPCALVAGSVQPHLWLVPPVPLGHLRLLRSFHDDDGLRRPVLLGFSSGTDIHWVLLPKVLLQSACITFVFVWFHIQRTFCSEDWSRTDHRSDSTPVDACFFSGFVRLSRVAATAPLGGPPPPSERSSSRPQPTRREFAMAPLPVLAPDASFALARVRGPSCLSPRWASGPPGASGTASSTLLS